MNWPRGASLPRSGDMDLLFAAVARIGRGGPTPLPPEGGVPFPRRNAAFRPAGAPAPPMTSAVPDFKSSSFAVWEFPLRRSLLTGCDPSERTASDQSFGAAKVGPFGQYLV